MSIREGGEVYDPLLRLVAHHGDAAETIESTLADLQALVEAR